MPYWYIYHRQHLTRFLLAILVLYDKRDTKIANKHRVKCWRWYIYQYGINDNHSYKKTKSQGIMNRLIYWLSEELMFVMIYQCHHCCVLLLVRRQQNLWKIYFCSGKYSFSHIKFVVLLLVWTRLCVIKIRLKGC